MKILIGWSGGKDSQASLIWAVHKYGADKITAVFCDTGWEHEDTYKHVNEVCEKLAVKLVVVKNKKFDGFVGLAKKKKRFPSTKARFCTEKLKTEPMIDYILSLNDHCLIIQGIRSDESEDRSKMSRECTYFKYYFQPYTDNEKKIKALEKIKLKKGKLTSIQQLKYDKAFERLSIGKLDAKYHTYRKKEIFEFRNNYADDIFRPVFDWTVQQVIDYIIQNDQKPNPLYYKGMGRVGCMPCVMCRHSEIKSMVKFLPESVERLRSAEKEIGRSFFPPDYIPKRFQTGFDPKSGKSYPVVDDVLKYVAGDDNQTELYEQEGEHRCMSIYMICE